jgi:hypothetical protein
MSASAIPFWGQSYSLEVTYATADGPATTVISSDSWEPDALKITFDVLQSTLPSPWWFADIVIYNLNTASLQNTLVNATSCVLKAGFQTGPAKSAVIWSGPILQVLLDRENVVDVRCTLHCVANPLVMDEITSFSVGRFASQYDVVSKMAAQIGLPAMTYSNGTAVTNNTLSAYAQNALTTKRYPRGNTVFGKMSKHLEGIADDHFMATFRDGSKAYMTEISDGKTVVKPNYVYSPTYPPNTVTLGALPDGTTESILGTPRQTPQGVIFTVMLDPRLLVQVPPLCVQLVNTNITQLAVTPNEQYVAPLGGAGGSTDITLFVGQVRHFGDSRGNDWGTEVTGYTTAYANNLLDGLYSTAS